jgi:hypothetical protein
MTAALVRDSGFGIRDSGFGNRDWIPAFAGMTREAAATTRSV